MQSSSSTPGTLASFLSHDLSLSPSERYEDEKLISAITAEVELYFQNPAFDSSHDFVHIRRVVKLAKAVMKAERSSASQGATQPVLDETLVTLGALLHDVGDYKYQSSDSDLITAKSLLLKHGASLSLAEKVQTVVSNVSYTNETRNPQAVSNLCADIPELAVVQDADRLDAIGAIGIGRCFTFGGARGRELDDTVRHFEVKLLKLESMMKTGSGRRMARERTARLRSFVDWWSEEWSILEQ